jgi:hypothetical protein
MFPAGDAVAATAIDALFTYAPTGSVPATIVTLAGPHLDVLIRSDNR